jgi:hypothetical protein
MKGFLHLFEMIPIRTLFMLFEIKFTNAYMSFASVNQATVIVQRSYEPGVVSV